MKVLSSVFCLFVFLSFAGCNGEKPVSGNENGDTSGSVTEVEAEKAAELVSSNPDLVILDIRTPEEFAEGHIEGAVNIDFKADTFAAQVGELDPGKPYLLHCRSGNRSGQSIPLFEGLNFEEIYHLDSGFNGWKEAGKPVKQ